MGKRRNEQPPGGKGKFQVPQSKRSWREDSVAPGDQGSEGTGRVTAGDAGDRAPAPRDPGSAARDTPRSPNGAEEAAVPEQSRAGERSPSPSPQEGRDPGLGLFPAAAASPPEPPHGENSVPEGAGGGRPVGSAARQGSPGEAPEAGSQTLGGTGDAGDGPQPGEEAAGGEMALPTDAPGGAGTPDPHREEGGDGDAEPSPEPPPVNAGEGESGEGSEEAAGGEQREAAEDLGGCPPGAEGTGAAGTAAPVSLSPPKTSGDADGSREEDGGGDAPAAGSCSAPDPAVPEGGIAAGGSHGEGGAEEPEPPGGNGPRLPPTQPPPPPAGAAVEPGRNQDPEPPIGTEGKAPAQPQLWEDASAVVCGLILELSNLNRLAMGAHRGLESLRRPKPRRSRWPGGRRRKEPEPDPAGLLLTKKPTV